MENILRLAVQRSGRLFDESIRLVKECGVSISSGHSALRVRAQDFPVELYYLRDDDIPRYVADGVADVGIVGLNVVEEKAIPVTLTERLGFGVCRLSLAVPRAMEYHGPATLQNARIATSYPKILSQFLEKNGITADLHEISGSVEIAPGIGLSDAICDLVSTGSTLLKNGLKEVEQIFQSEAVMIARRDLDDERGLILEKLLGRIRSVLAARSTKYIMLNVPNESVERVSALLPGVKSPSVLPLKKEGWSSLHSVVKENDFWEVVERVKEAGAEGILILPIEKIIK
ncbi:MAG: ATP phosphoribosyltransferase [Bdellovibrionales bacterium]|nr:ATP phosphoribosyltransferase [Bdellovibrionales bacterium]